MMHSPLDLNKEVGKKHRGEAVVVPRYSWCQEGLERVPQKGVLSRALPALFATLGGRGEQPDTRDRKRYMDNGPAWVYPRSHLQRPCRCSIATIYRALSVDPDRSPTADSGLRGRIIPC